MQNIVFIFILLAFITDIFPENSLMPKKRKAIFFGIDNYEKVYGKSLDNLKSLEYIRRIANILEERGDFNKKSDIEIYENEKVTKRKILKVLEKEKSTNKDEFLFVYYKGHGLVKDLIVYPEEDEIGKTVYTVRVVDLMESLNATGKKYLLIIDACRNNPDSNIIKKYNLERYKLDLENYEDLARSLKGDFPTAEQLNEKARQQFKGLLKIPNYIKKNSSDRFELNKTAIDKFFNNYTGRYTKEGAEKNKKELEKKYDIKLNNPPYLIENEIIDGSKIKTEGSYIIFTALSGKPSEQNYFPEAFTSILRYGNYSYNNKNISIASERLRLDSLMNLNGRKLGDSGEEIEVISNPGIKTELAKLNTPPKTLAKISPVCRNLIKNDYKWEIWGKSYTSFLDIFVPVFAYTYYNNTQTLKSRKRYDNTKLSLYLSAFTELGREPNTTLLFAEQSNRERQRHNKDLLNFQNQAIGIGTIAYFGWVLIDSKFIHKYKIFASASNIKNSSLMASYGINSFFGRNESVIQLNYMKKF